MLPFLGDAQTTIQQGTPNTIIKNRGGFSVDSMAKVAPIRDTTSYYSQKGDFIRLPIDSTLWYFDGHYYQKIGSGGESGLDSATVLDLIADSAKNIGNSDLKIPSGIRYLTGNSDASALVIDSIGHIVLGSYPYNSLSVLNASGARATQIYNYNLDTTYSASIITSTPSTGAAIMALSLDSLNKEDLSSNKSIGIGLNSETKEIRVQNDWGTGISYVKNYHSTFDSLSLVDKSYVDSVVGNHYGGPTISSEQVGISVSLQSGSTDKFGILYIENTTGSDISNFTIKVDYSTEFSTYAVANVTPAVDLGSYWLPDVATEGSQQTEIFYISIGTIPANTTYSFNYNVSGY